MLSGVQDVHYCVRDMQRAVAFYRDVLGMRVLDSNDWWTSLEFFGARIGLHWTGGAAVPPVLHDERGARHGATLTLRSTDLDADLGYLQKMGCPLLGRSDNPWGRLAALTDPDGNVLKLMQPPPAASTKVPQ
ncbi:MAG: VOC family protein [Burkholderiaceae bacterium]|nr:VOC family protein [Burkholderiaceae bacterium]